MSIGDIRASADETATANLDVMRRLDFEALNGSDWELFEALHADDVSVLWKGTRTDGLGAHVRDVKAALAGIDDPRIVAHPIEIAAGEWTCVVAELASGARAAVIARVVDGRIVEEHLFDG